MLRDRKNHFRTATSPATDKNTTQDDGRLHKLCQSGNLEKVLEFVANISDNRSLKDRLANRKGVFGYTPLHEAVASGHHDILNFLLLMKQKTLTSLAELTAATHHCTWPPAADTRSV